ncbi:unnamed protein product, partial [Brassica oleracea]
QVVDQIEGRGTAPSIAEVHEKLLNFEVKLQSKTTTPATTPITANVANYRGSNQSNNTRNSSYQGRGSNNNRNQQQTWQQQQFSTPGGQPPRGYQGRCQFCNVQGHSAKHCPQLQNVPAVSQSSRPFTPNASSWNPRANVAITQPYNPNSWILDSGATHHLTTDLANLSLHQPYTGGEEVTISDGSNLPISHTVKDLSTGLRLLQGKTNNECYEWPLTSQNTISLFAASTSKTNQSTWHSPLGHPSFSVFQTVASKFSLP